MNEQLDLHRLNIAAWPSAGAKIYETTKHANCIAKKQSSSGLLSALLRIS